MAGMHVARARSAVRARSPGDAIVARRLLRSAATRINLVVQVDAVLRAGTASCSPSVARCTTGELTVFFFFRACELPLRSLQRLSKKKVFAEILTLR